MNWITPVVNRTIDSKHDAVDLNRIGNNIAYLGERFVIGFASEDEEYQSPKTDWDQYGIPTLSYYNYLMLLLSRLKESVDVVPEDLPDIPEAPFLYYNKMNEVERFLLLLYENCYGNSHGELVAYTHEQLGAYTHQYLKDTKLGGQNS